MRSGRERRIGIVVPTRNAAETLAATLLSLTAQDQVDAHIIAADSESTDGTREILAAWNIETIDVPPGNMYRAVNAAMEHLQTPWLTYVNADDILYRDALVRLMAAGDESGASIVYGNCDYSDWHGRFLFGFSAAKAGDLLPLAASKILGFGQHAAIFRKECWRDLHGFDETFRFASDLDFFTRALNSGASVKRLGGPPVALFRIHDRQLSHVQFDAMEQEKRTIARQVRASWWSRRLSLWRWRIHNARAYAIRVLRRATLRNTT